MREAARGRDEEASVSTVVELVLSCPPPREPEPQSALERVSALRTPAGEGGPVQNRAITAAWRVALYDRVVGQRWFSHAVLVAIFLNCVTLAMANPARPSDDPVIVFTERAEVVFAAVFGAEMLLKFAALGLFHEHGYFRDRFNVLDFVIVVAGFASFVPGVGNFTSVRVMRALRPLRAVRRVPGLRAIVSTLLTSLSALGSVSVILLFLFLVYAIVGVQLWAGNLRQQCFAAGDASFEEPLGAFCSLGAGGYRCGANATCAPEAPPPNAGLVGFDNVAMGVLTILQVSTLSDWARTMFAVMDTSNDYVPCAYFVSIVLVASYFAMTVVSSVFTGLSDQSRAEKKVQREEERRRASMSEAEASLVTLALRDVDEYSMTRGPSTSPSSSAAGACMSKSTSASSASTSSRGSMASLLGTRKAAATASSRLSSMSLPVLEENDDEDHKAAEAAGPEAEDDHSCWDRDDGPTPPPLPLRRLPSELKSVRLLQAVTPLLGAARNELDLQLRYLERRPRWFVHVHTAVTGVWFGRFITAAIVGNTCVLAAEYHGMSDTMRGRLEAANAAFTSLFLAEMALKLVALGPAGYARDSSNLFDAAIISVSVFEYLALSGGALSVLRAFRLLRIVRLVKSHRSLRVLLDTIVSSLWGVVLMNIVLVMWVYMYAVLGMQVFAGKWENIPPESRPRSSFDNFYWAYLTTFQVITGDDWPDLMAAGVLATGTQASIVYFISLTLFSIFVVLHLFISVLLEAFDDQDEDHFELISLEGDARALAHELLVDGRDEVSALSELATALAAAKLAERQRILAREAALRRDGRPPRMEGRSFGVFSRDNCARRFCWGLVHTPHFRWFIVVCIVVSCALLCMENPGVEPGSRLGRFLFAADQLFVGLFLSELLVKFVAMGVYRNAGACLRDRWNVLDAFVVLAGLVSLLLPSVTAARSCRALRPLRVIVRSERIKMVASSLVRAVPDIFSVILFCSLWWTIFAILGVSLFGGKFYTCDADPSLSRAECGAVAGARWTNSDTHFDNIGASLLALFQVGTLSGWADIAYMAVDATAVDEAPRKNSQPQAALFFMVFIMVGCFFALQLVLGVVISNFNKVRAEVSDASAVLTRAQRRTVAVEKLLRHLSAVPTDSLRNLLQSSTGPDGQRRRDGPVRRVCRRVVSHRLFEPVIAGCIVANAAVMATQHWRQPDDLTAAQFALEVFFTSLFAAEAAVKVAATGWSLYWRSGWNRFDFFCVCAGVAGVASSAGVGAGVARVLRIGRVLRLLRQAGSLAQMFESLVGSLPALGNIALLLFIIFLIFAVVGIELFGAIEFGPRTRGINQDTNFKDFGHAMLTLYVLATGDRWEEIMFAARDEGRGGTRWAPLFFLAYLVVGVMMLCELYVAVVLESFCNAVAQESDGVEHDMEHYLERVVRLREVWARFDPRDTGSVPAFRMEEMMSAAPRAVETHSLRVRRARPPGAGRNGRGRAKWTVSLNAALECAALAMLFGGAGGDEGREAAARREREERESEADMWGPSCARAPCVRYWSADAEARRRPPIVGASLLEWTAVRDISRFWLRYRPRSARKGAVEV